MVSMVHKGLAEHKLEEVEGGVVEMHCRRTEDKVEEAAGEKKSAIHRTGGGGGLLPNQ
jgi:hypothetical protein